MAPREHEHGGTETRGTEASFGTTHWSVVLSAGERDSLQSTEALEQLCQLYWPPLYAYVRRQGYQPADAQDLIQEFFTRLLERNYISHADPGYGRFRTFLLTSLKHFLVSNWRRSQRQKRGGRLVVSWDALQADQGAGEAVSTLTPDQIFDERWALTLMERVLGLLRAEYTQAGKGHLFEQLKGCIWGEQTGASYAEIAALLGLSETMIKVSVHRLRHRCRDLLRAEVAHTVARPKDIDEELRYLLKIFDR